MNKYYLFNAMWQRCNEIANLIRTGVSCLTELKPHFIKRPSFWEHFDNLRTVLFNWLFMQCCLQRPVLKIWWTFDSFGPKIQCLNEIIYRRCRECCVVLVWRRFVCYWTTATRLEGKGNITSHSIFTCHHFLHQRRLNQLKFK